MKKVVLAIATLAATALLVGLTPSASAFHGSWWRGFGTATVGPLAPIGVDFVWGGQDVIINCAGGGCQGQGDGWYHFSVAGVALPPTRYDGATEDVRNILFNSTPNCGTNEVTPNYSLRLTGRIDLRGRQENCLDNFPTGNNLNVFTGTLEIFQVRIVANGGFRAGVPPAGAADAWCCHG